MKQRQSKFECLRIICMLFIISFHCVYKSRFDFSEGEGITNRIITDVFWYLGELGVNCFILISGYFFDKTHFTWKKLVFLICETEFYIIFCRLLLVAAGEAEWRTWSWSAYLFPILKGPYWFMTVYILIYILTPYFKKLMEVLSKKEMTSLLVVQLIIWSVYPTIILGILGSDNTESMPYYNRYIWLIIVYFIGAYIKLYGFPILKSKKQASLFLIGVAAVVLIYILGIEWKVLPLGGKKAYYFWPPNSVLELLLSIGLFSIFSFMEIKYRKWVNYVASCTLGIYMLHAGELEGFLWENVFRTRTYQDSPVLLIHILIATGMIFGMGVFVDSIRKFFSKILKRLFHICFHYINMWNGRNRE